MNSNGLNIFLFISLLIGLETLPLKTSVKLDNQKYAIRGLLEGDIAGVRFNKVNSTCCLHMFMFMLFIQ